MDSRPTGVPTRRVALCRCSGERTFAPRQCRPTRRRRRGGDGVDVIVYRNTEEWKRWRVNGDDGNGINDGVSVAVTPGDFIFTVIKIGGDPSFDETGIRAQIYP